MASLKEDKHHMASNCEQPLGPENGPWPTANMTMGTSITQQQREFCQEDLCLN